MYFKYTLEDMRKCKYIEPVHRYVGTQRAHLIADMS